MRRRDFIKVTAGVAAAWPFAAPAQQGAPRRVGALLALSQGDVLAQSYITILRQSLRDLGWDENRNLSIDFRFAGDDPERARAQASELISLNAEVIFAQSGLVLPALQNASRSTAVVFVQVFDPVASGFVRSLSQPGSNMTGFANAEFSSTGKMVEVLKEVAPSINHVAVVMNSEQSPQRGMMSAIESAALSQSIPVTRIDAHDPSEIELSIETFGQTPNGGLIVLPNPITNRHRDLIILAAARHRLPAIYRYRHFVASGGLICYGERPEDAVRSAASYIDRILRGARPGDGHQSEDRESNRSEDSRIVPAACRRGNRIELQIAAVHHVFGIEHLLRRTHHCNSFLMSVTYWERRR